MTHYVSSSSHSGSQYTVLIPIAAFRKLAKATHDSCPDAIFVLDGIAAGNKWADMEELGVDVYITAPQKGWTGPACVGIAMMSERACDIMARQNAISPRGEHAVL